MTNEARLTLEQVARKALAIHDDWYETACADSAFDGGECSAAAAMRMADRQIAALVEAEGYTMDDVFNEMNRITNTEDDDGQTA